jgi:hypothetical protein
LLGAEAPAQPASPPDAAGQEPASESEAVAAPPKKSKKREARVEPAYKPEEAAAQALQNFFGN